MEKQAVLHKTKSNYAYAYDETTIHLRLRSKKNDLRSVTLITDHEDGWVETKSGKWIWKKQNLEMKKEFSTELFDYWFIEFQPSNFKMRYGFMLNDGKQEILFVERGFFDPNDSFLENDINSYFSFPYIHKSDLFTAPDWVKDTIWYQIFPDRYAKADSSGKTVSLSIEQDGKSDLGENTFHGGNLRGIINKLSYLKDLGITGIYLTPIFKAPTAHKYDTEDYYEIDSRFGTKEDLRELVSKAHDLGIKVMLDAVFNHIGITSYQFRDAILNKRKSKYYDWFYFENEEYRNFSPNMPKLNTSNPEVINYLLSVARYWILETDIDGWRLDVANEVDHNFWKLFRQAVKQIKPDIYICGEVWHDSQAWLHGDQFDGVMNYPLAKPIQEWIAAERIDGMEFLEEFIHAYTRYPKNQNLSMFTLLDSHDTPRITNWAGGDHRKVDMCFALLATIPGSICFYYGSEVYLNGADDPDNRRCMDWDSNREKSNIKLLATLRKRYPEFGSYGEYSFLSVNRNSIIFEKKSRNSVIYFLFNTQARQCIELPEKMKEKNYLNLISNEKVNVKSHVQLEEYSYLILKPEMEEKENEI